MKIAVAACRSEDGATLYPDADWPLLESALAERGIDAHHLPWDHSAIAWESFDLVLIRSTWDSVDRPSEFLAWTAATSSQTLVANAAEVVAWNLDKHYLEDVRAAGIAVVPTTWVEPGDAWSAPTGAFVVKPAISAGGRETVRYDASNAHDAEAHVARLSSVGSSVMVQPYVSSVDDAGETKLVFVDGRFTHAMVVGALLDHGEGVMERPWEKEVSITPASPRADQLAVATSILDVVAARFGAMPLYARVDVVDHDGRPTLMELELIDPVLFLGASPPAAGALAAAIERALR